MKKNKILLLITFSTILYLCVANILHIAYLNQYTVFNKKESNVKTLEENLKIFENKINELANTNIKNLSKDEKLMIVDQLKIVKNNFKNNFIFKLKDEEKIYLSDIVGDKYNFQTYYFLNLLAKMGKENETINTFLKLNEINSISKIYAVSFSGIEYKNAYKYQTPSLILNENFNSINDDLLVNKSLLLHTELEEFILYCELLLKGAI